MNSQVITINGNSRFEQTRQAQHNLHLAKQALVNANRISDRNQIYDAQQLVRKYRGQLNALTGQVVPVKF